MAVQTSYPGVYIDEFTPGAPIQGVGTSTAAFLGIAARGELDTPTKVTSWDQFRQTFGELPAAGFFLWYAVRGFFENGGQVCYVVRVSNGDYQELALVDRSAAGNDIIRVRARQPGIPATAIQITVADHHELTTADTSVFQPHGHALGRGGDPHHRVRCRGGRALSTGRRGDRGRRWAACDGRPSDRRFVLRVDRDITGAIRGHAAARRCRTGNAGHPPVVDGAEHLDRPHSGGDAHDRRRHECRLADRRVRADENSSVAVQ